MSSKERKNKFLIDENSIDMRLDNYLLKQIKDVPRSKIYKIIRKGEVRVNSKRIKPLSIYHGDSQLFLLSRIDQYPFHSYLYTRQQDRNIFFRLVPWLLPRHVYF